jgi:DNA polymerase type B, organellar and viral
MRSAHHYGQRKRKREEKMGEPLRLYGGMMGRGRGRGGPVPVVGPGRTALHQQWDERKDWEYGHHSQFQNAPLVYGVPEVRINNWLPFMNNAAFPPWDLFQNGDEEWEAMNPNDMQSFPGAPAQTGFRQDELFRLMNHGTHNVMFHGGVGQAEARWAFLGISDANSFGRAWTCFYYGLSDMYINGFPLFSDILASITSMATDIVAVGNPYIRADMRVMVSFEGLTDETTGARVYLHCSDRAVTLETLMEDPLPILECVLNYFTSDATFLFYRVYFHVNTNLGGAGLKSMPEQFRKLREGKFFTGRPGFIPIADPGDGSCGLYAVLMALAGVTRKIADFFKNCEKTAPKLCQRFQKYREYVSKGKLTAKVKSLQNELKFELASFIGWKQGTPIQPEALCDAVFQFNEKHKLDIGLVILDAINPIATNYVSYNRNGDIPRNMLALIHWSYNAVGGSLPTGHYDCINSKNITSWIQSRQGEKRKDMRFSFRQLKLLPSTQADDKGNLCLFCKHWQLDMTPRDWEERHGGTQLLNSILCDRCNVNFKSMACYQNHLKKSHGTSVCACESQSLCYTCEKVHINKYDCDAWYCEICCEKFPLSTRTDHVCYLKCISSKRKGRLRKVIYSDMEGSRSVGWHQAVCIASYYSMPCDEHMELLSNKKKLCDDCRENNLTWDWLCPACSDSKECKECNLRYVKYFDEENCLSLYLDWIMTSELGSTVVFHNGGKYDLHMIYVELLSKSKYLVKKDAMRGSQIIFMSATPIEYESKRSLSKCVRFIDSCCFINTSLRNFTKAFNLEEESGDKGRFPYELLNTENWRQYNGECPPVGLFGITEKEIQNVDKLSDQRGREVKEIIEYVKEQRENKKTWNAMKKLKKYTIQDVKVLYGGCEKFRFNFWRVNRVDPFQWVTLASAVNGAYRQERFMPEKSIQTCDMESRLFQHQGLRGGKCEAFKLYWKQKKPTEELYVFDINSEYPYVQAYGYYAVGAMTADMKYQKPVTFLRASIDFYNKCGVFLHDVLEYDTGERGCGIIQCEIAGASDAFFPILPHKVKTKSYTKNMFMNRNGTWTGFMNVLACAIKHNQVRVKTVSRIQFWKNVSNTLFRDFILNMYKEKVHASGWNSVLPGLKGEELEETKKIFIVESLRRDVKIDSSAMEENPAMRMSTKIGLNSGWGYMCQRQHAHDNNYFDNDDIEEVEEMGDLLENIGSDERPGRLVGMPTAVGQYTRVRTTKKPEDISKRDMNKKIAYHVGGQVPAHGLVLISNAILSLHPSQVCYTDTDSIMYLYDSKDPLHKKLPEGYYLGDFVNEYPDYAGIEFACTGPKSYFIKLKHKETGKILYKGRFKGVPMCSSAFSLLSKDGDIATLNMEEMKKIIRDAVDKKDPEAESLTYVVHYTNYFKRNSDFKIKEVKEKKTIRFTFDKRNIIKPVNYETLEELDDWFNRVGVCTQPITDADVDLDIDSIWAMWEETKKKVERECKKV